MRLILTLASLAIIYKGIMDTGDATNLFSNLLVLYAMYYVSYQDTVKESSIKFVKAIRYVVIVVGFVCFAGWIKIITINDIDGQYFISISKSMRLGDKPLINVHIFILILAIKLSIFAAIEWFIGLWNEKSVDIKNMLKDSERKGA